MDRCYCYVWANKREPPLIQMQKEQVNMFDVRRELGVKSVRWKVEKRVLERIGHVVRMDDSRVTKACVFGWMAELERYPKPVGRGRKTVCYWKKILREAGLDYTDIYGLTSDRKKWKGLITERMKAISKWEDSQGHTWQGEQPLRNTPVVAVQVFDCRVCGKVCKSKGGLTLHLKVYNK